ncbi:MAG: His/Gly/Thr/Pro-type tRNA ligase C-terminal domain-containing protein, partial [Nitrospiria bacterium]
KGDAGLKSHMKRADKLGAEYVLIVGETELSQGKAILRDMTTKSQATVGLKTLMEDILAQINKKKMD